MKRIIQIGLLTVISILAALFYFLNPAEHQLFPKCIFYSTTGYHCPGCGSQRAIHSLLHLDFAGVVSNNILFLPAALLVIYHYVHPLLNKLFNWKLPNIFYYKSTPWIILVIVVLFWILRNLPFYPFTFLAPD
jgi:hypothetical protein